MDFIEQSGIRRAQHNHADCQRTMVISQLTISHMRCLEIKALSNGARIVTYASIGTDITNDDSLPLSVSVMKSTVMIYIPRENSDFSAILQTRSRTNVSTRLQLCEGLARREDSPCSISNDYFFLP